MGWICVPRHLMELDCALVRFLVSVGVRPELPAEAVCMILGNDMAGGRVWAGVPLPSVVSNPSGSEVLEKS